MQKNGEHKMLNNQSRNCLVNTYAKFGEAEKVAQAFGVTKWTVYRLSKQMERTGSVELRTSTRGRKSKIEEHHNKKILEMLRGEPDLTLDEIRNRLHLNCSITTIHRAVKKLGFFTAPV